MPAPLHETQLRHLYFGLAHLDKQLTHIEAILASGSSRSPFPQHIADLSAGEREQLEQGIAGIRAAILALLAAHGLRPEPANMPMRKAIRTNLTFAEIGAEDLSPANLRGYGPLDSEQALTLEAATLDLRSRIADLLTRFGATPEGDPDSSLKALPDSEAATRLRRLDVAIRAAGFDELRPLVSQLAVQLAAVPEAAGPSPAEIERRIVALGNLLTQADRPAPEEAESWLALEREFAAATDDTHARIRWQALATSAAEAANGVIAAMANAMAAALASRSQPAEEELRLIAGDTFAQRLQELSRQAQELLEARRAALIAGLERAERLLPELAAAAGGFTLTLPPPPKPKVEPGLWKLVKPRFAFGGAAEKFAVQLEPHRGEVEETWQSYRLRLDRWFADALNALGERYCQAAEPYRAQVHRRLGRRDPRPARAPER